MADPTFEEIEGRALVNSIEDVAAYISKLKQDEQILVVKTAAAYLQKFKTLERCPYSMDFVESCIAKLREEG